MTNKPIPQDTFKYFLARFQKPPPRFTITLLIGGFVVITLAMVIVSGNFHPALFMRTASAVEAKPTATQIVKQNPADGILKISKDEIPVLQSLQQRQAILDKREQTVAQKEEELAQLQKHLEEKLANLSMLRREIGELIEERDAFEERRFEHLVKVYEGMKPAEAAPLVERLKNETAVRLFYRMKEKKVSRILGFIKPEIAARLSEHLASYQNTNEQASSSEERK